MEKTDILLVYISLPVKEPNIVSPLQIMKGLFLISKELNFRNFYKFEPYLYGPCSFEVYNDLNILLEKGLIMTIQSTYSSWAYYKVTPRGKVKSKEVLSRLEKETIEKLLDIKKRVVSKNFIELLKYIYKSYPEYAINSIIDVGEIK